MSTTDITEIAPQPLPRRAERQPYEEEVGARVAVMGVTAVSVGCIAAVMYAAISGISNWSEVVLAGIALATVGLMIAIDPLRRDS